jgi:surface antigen Omp85-like protein
VFAHDVFAYVLSIVWLACGPLASPTFAQSPEPATRAEALRLERDKKEKVLTENKPDALQRGLDYVEGRALHLLTKDGFFPKLGSLTTGSGFAFGGGYRNREIFDRYGVAEVWTAGSLKKYWAVQASAAFPHLANRRLMTEVVADVREYPEERFFGLGPDSQRANEIRFSLRQTDFRGRAGVRLVPALLVGANVGLFTPKTVAGSIDYLRTGGFVEVDYRQPLNARRGGWYRADFNHFDDRDGSGHSFDRTDFDVRQYFGFLADRRVIALRAYASSLTPDDGAEIPFYLMPSLGGNDSLRGFRNYRFRGPHALLLQGEYRWEIWSGLDGALFYDAGKVAMKRADLNLKDLEKDYGFGFRFNTDNGVVVRVDAAFGSKDGKHLHIVFGGVF